MYAELSGKRALVTGASRGFGRAIALRLAREGAVVAVNYRRSKSEALAVVEEIQELGGGAVAIRADVGDEESLDRLFSEIESEFHGLDIVVANAAFGIPGPVMDSTPKYWDVTMDASARSLIGLAQRAVPLMGEGWGRIISITSAAGQRVLPGYGLMSIAKAALEAVTRNLAVELAPRGILVSGILAGVSDPKALRSPPNCEALLDETLRCTPAGRMVTPDDISSAVAFLCSNQASMICGQFIVVDGGYGILA
jgi:enoyl-[acyl-carrier protein] reductase III